MTVREYISYGGELPVQAQSRGTGRIVLFERAQGNGGAYGKVLFTRTDGWHDKYSRGDSDSSWSLDFEVLL